MLLSEAFIEKDYVYKSIQDLCNIIENLLVSSVNNDNEDKTNKNLLVLSGKLDDLDKLYTKYQQFIFLIDKAKDDLSIELNDSTIGLGKTMVVKDTMSDKLGYYYRFINLFKPDVNNTILERLHNEIKSLRSDIKTLDIKVQNKLWDAEI